MKDDLQFHQRSNCGLLEGGTNHLYLLGINRASAA